MRKAAQGLVTLSLLCLSSLLPSLTPSALAAPLCADGVSVNTALGCLNIAGPQMIQTLVGWGIGIAGGIAFLMLIYAAFLVTTARGDAKTVKAGQELITAAITGLVLIAFSVVILNFLGVNVLGLQNLGFNVRLL